MHALRNNFHNLGRRFGRFRLYQSHNKEMPKTAGIIVVGDEILKGQTKDINSHHMCQSLHELGVDVKQISVIRDDVDVIASETKKFSALYDIVLTSGGIGPTHDDVTIEGIAKAFEERVVPNPTLVELCKKYFGQGFKDTPKMKLACTPQSAELHFGVDKVKGERLQFPLISVKNVYIFPGIPVLLNRLFDNLKHLFTTDDHFFMEKLLVNAFETDIAPVLTACAKKFDGAGVQIGSYPDWFNNYYKVKVTVESANEDATKAALKELKDKLPQGCLLDSHKYCSDPVAQNGVEAFADIFETEDPILHHKIENSIEILNEALTMYSLDELCIGFNGGKDCTALLHLLYAAICRKYPQRNSKLQALYIQDEHPFEELEEFMKHSTNRYNLNVITMKGAMKAALDTLQSQQPYIKAVVMGTRCTDPYSKNLSAFTPTDGDWPYYMRISPILNWSYRDIWTFLRKLSLPYCVLYDRGYTSLGSRDKTQRNEKLRYTDNQNNVKYRPAHCLQNEDLERNGRL
uniref:FAD synthase n=1 Tax=Phallusia mammillata TaxID=59560 RepID=A0A6F9DDJ6_9ASCI|nr:FAD synthase [Phallusia mammillata]